MRIIFDIFTHHVSYESSLSSSLFLLQSYLPRFLLALVLPLSMLYGSLCYSLISRYLLWSLSTTFISIFHIAAQLNSSLSPLLFDLTTSIVVLVLLLYLSLLSCFTHVSFLNSICSIFCHCLNFPTSLLVTLLFLSLCCVYLLILGLSAAPQFILWNSFTTSLLMYLFIFDLFCVHLLIPCLSVAPLFNWWNSMFWLNLCSVFSGFYVACRFNWCVCLRSCVVLTMEWSPTDVPFPYTPGIQLLIQL